MSFKNEKVFLDQTEIALKNGVEEVEISEYLSEYGLNRDAIAIGTGLHTSAKKEYEVNSIEAQEANESYQIYETTFEEVETIYRKDRKLAKIALDHKPSYLERLGVTGKISLNHVLFVSSAEQFYNCVKKDTEVSDALAFTKINPAKADSALLKIEAVKAARRTYLREKGQSEEATTAKDEAFVKLDNWMSSFYKTARIALEDKPQLLEALGIVVK